MLLFTAQWCNPCKQLKKWLDSVDFDITLVDVDEQNDVAKQHGIKGIPALLDGSVLKVGNEQIRPYLERTYGTK